MVILPAVLVVPPLSLLGEYRVCVCVCVYMCVYVMRMPFRIFIDRETKQSSVVTRFFDSELKIV